MLSGIIKDKWVLHHIEWRRKPEIASCVKEENDCIWFLVVMFADVIKKFASAVILLRQTEENPSLGCLGNCYVLRWISMDDYKESYYVILFFVQILYLWVSPELMGISWFIALSWTLTKGGNWYSDGCGHTFPNNP